MLQVRNLAARVLVSIKEMSDDDAVPRLTREQHRMALPGAGCWSPRCHNMAAPAEDMLRLVKCAACGVAKYCSKACQKAHWPAHKAACESRP